MKVAIGILFVLGVVAAACAAFLVSGLNATTLQTRAASANTEANPTVTVLYITRTVSAMTVVDGGLIESRQIPVAGAPAGYIASSTDVLGKVLSRPLIAGEAFTKACFAEMTGGKQLAGVIPPGKRAVGISVTDYSALDGLIYPGSMVDVMVSFRDDSSSESRRDAVTTTLVENVQVLAFEQQSVVSPGHTLPDLDVARTGATRRVTLLVDTKQSKALELAMQQGTLSLALCNPLDSASGDKESVSVSSLMGELPPIKSPPSLPPNNTTAKGSDTSLFTSPPVPVESSELPNSPLWQATVIRGATIETQSFPMASAIKPKHQFSKQTIPSQK